MVLEIPTYEDVAAAAGRLKGYAKRTPLIRHDRLDAICGFNLFLKNETAQKTGTFKYRGAYSRMSLLSARRQSAGRCGVLVWQSRAGRCAGGARAWHTARSSSCPKSAPQKKKQGTLALGAKIVEYDIATQSREEIAAQIGRDENRIVVPAFDDKYVIAGQGTCGVEIVEQCAEQGVTLDALITPMGGGGLCAGLSLALNHLSPTTKIYGTEPIKL